MWGVVFTACVFFFFFFLFREIYTKEKGELPKLYGTYVYILLLLWLYNEMRLPNHQTQEEGNASPHKYC